MPTPFDPKEYVWDAGMAAAAMSRELIALREHKRRGCKTGFAGLDKHMSTLLPGEVGVILARPSTGKTTVIANMGCREAATGGLPVLISTEQPREAIEMKVLSRATGIPTSVIREGGYDEDTFNRLMAGVENRKDLGLILVGYSAETVGEIVRLNAKQMMLCVDWLKKQGLEPTWLGVDYLQEMPPNRGSGVDTTSDLMAVMSEVRDFAKRARCPIWITCQARREVDDSSPFIPDMRDAQWASRIEQAADVVISLMRPIDHWAAGDSFKLKGKFVTCRENMLLAVILKQRDGPRNIYVWLEAWMHRNQVGDFTEEAMPWS